MNSLFQAIWNKFSANTTTGFYKDISGKMYLDSAPQGTQFPYCTYFSVDGQTEYDFSDENVDFLLQFDIFTQSNSSIQAGQLLESLKTMFDDCSLTVTGWRHLDFKRIDPGIALNDNSQEPPIKRYKVEYEVLLEKGRS